MPARRPERLGASRLRHRAGGSRPFGPALFQLVFCLIALVVLLVFMNQLGQGAAGCFSRLTAPVDAAASAPDTTGDPSSRPPPVVTPSVLPASPVP